MNRSLSLLFLFIPALLCAGDSQLAPTTRKGKNICSLTARLQRGSPRAEKLLKITGPQIDTGSKCDTMSITLLTPSLEVMPSLLLHENKIVHVSFFSRAAHRRNPGSTALLNVNKIGHMQLANFPWILVGSTFPSPLGEDPITVFKPLKTSSLSPDTLKALGKRIDVIDLRNTSIGKVPGEIVETFAPETRQVCLSEDTGLFDRRVNEATSCVDIKYGEPDVEIHVDNRDPGVLSLFPTPSPTPE